MFRKFYNPEYVFGLAPLNCQAHSGGSARVAPKKSIARYMPEHLRDWNYHMLRHNFRTCMSENHRHVLDQAVDLYLAHQPKSDIRNTYDHYKYADEMREVANIWEREVMRKINPPSPNVIKLKTA